MKIDEEIEEIRTYTMKEAENVVWELFRKYEDKQIAENNFLTEEEMTL